MKTYFITGVAGFIGSNLAQKILSEDNDIQIIGLDNMNDYYDVKLKEYRLKELEEFKGKELTSHQCYIELNSIGNKLLKEADDEEYESNKKLNNLIDRFDDNECDLKGVLKYYNDNAVEINNYRHKFPSNIVGLFLHYKELDIYKIEKRESFAILSK